MTRILFFLPSLGGGGAESHVVRIANGLVAAGHHIAIAVARSGGSYESRLLPSIKIVHLLNCKIPSSTASIAIAVLPLCRRLRTGHYDAVVTATALCHAAASLALRISGSATRSICLAQNNPEHEVSCYPDSVRRLIRRAYRDADLVIALSRGVAGALRRSIRPNPLPMLAIANAGYDTDLASKLGQPIDFTRPERTLVVACGRLHRQKAYPDMLRTFARLREAHGIDAELWVMGIGPEERNIRALIDELGIANDVHLLGFVPNPYAVMRHADIFLLTSHWEGFGNVIVEAMSCGLPVVVTNCPYGPSEIVRDGTDGRLLPVGDIEGLAGALAELIRDTTKREAMAQAARLRAHSFDPGIISDKYGRVLSRFGISPPDSEHPLVVAFAHDHRFTRDHDGTVWSGGRFRPDHWHEYQIIAPFVRVYAREIRAGAEFEPARYVRNTTPGTQFNLIDEPVSIWKIARCMDEIRDADLVIARLPSVIGVAMAMAAIHHRKALYVEAVGCAWDAYWNHGARSARAIAPIMYLTMRTICMRANFIRYVTSSFLQRRYPSHAAQTAISDVRLLSLGNVTTHPKDMAVLGSIGAFSTKAKGFHIAIEAVAAMKRAGRIVRLELVGPGPTEWITDLAISLGCETQVVNVGILPGPQAISDWLDSIDLYLQPSFQEGLPRALIEAMARGRPALGSSVGGIPELLDASCLHRPGDAATLATQCIDLLADPERFSRMSQRNLRNAARFLPQVMERDLNLFLKTINRRLMHRRRRPRCLCASHSH